MNRRAKKIRRELRSLVALVLAAGAVRGFAQSANYDDDMVVPDMTAPRLRYLKVDSEFEQNSYTPKTGSVSVNSQRIYLAPAAGIGWDYFIYHPALFSFQTLFEPGYSQQQYQGTSANGSSDSMLLNGNFTGELLREKAYATTMNYSRTHGDYHYDFYNSATVDTESWSTTTGYRDGPVPVTLSLTKTDSNSEGVSQSTKTDQWGVQLHARNERKDRNVTDLSYQYNQLEYDTFYKLASYSTLNSHHLVTLTDTEHFEHSTLGSSVRFYDISSKNSESSDLNASLAFSMEHTPNLHSFYNYAFTRYDGNGAESINNYGTAGIQHQLYESLSSGANVHGSTLNSSFSGSKFNSQTIGVGQSEDYNKRIGEWANLSLGNNINYDTTFQQTDTTLSFIADESYTLPSSGPMIIRLKSPRDVSVSSVKKNGVDLAPAEWTTITATDPWQIQFFTGGPNNIQPGDVITISYTVSSNGTGSYNVFTDDARISFRFWHNRAEVYLRYSMSKNAASSPDFLLQDFNEFSAGGDVMWNGFRAQASYVDHRSTLYDYRSVNLSEGYSMPVTLHSTAGVDFNQQWNVYPPGSGISTNATQTATFYNFMAHYDWTPVANFNWHIESGYQTQNGLGYDQNLFAARTYFNWTIGKLELHLGYEHDTQSYTAEERVRDFGFVRMRRNF